MIGKFNGIKDREVRKLDKDAMTVFLFCFLFRIKTRSKEY